ncbi:PRELI-like family-domain-containing protein [Paraphysoderma sedebokerense]|nr:PRELI-like family-domain-containing protein [Paraphysoderma sedebokerense]
MVKFYQQKFEFEHSWNYVTLAIFNKYPNPFSTHVLQSDVLTRTLNPNTKTLHTTRLFTKSGVLPKWGASLFKSAPQALIVEESVVDLEKKTMITRTRNLDHRRFLCVEEIQVVKPHPENNEWTQVTTEARVVSNIGWGMTNKLEKFGVSRFRDNLTKVCRQLTSP